VAAGPCRLADSPTAGIVYAKSATSPRKYCARSYQFNSK
jgi:hypothetical protein